MKQCTMTGKMLYLFAHPAQFMPKRAARIVYIRQQRAETDHCVIDSFIDDQPEGNTCRAQQWATR